MTTLAFSLKGQSKTVKHEMERKLKTDVGKTTIQTKELSLQGYTRNLLNKGSKGFSNELGDECGLTNALLIASTKLSSSI